MTCASYHPDLMVMGDCSNCGHTAQAHEEQDAKIRTVIDNLRGTSSGSLDSECEAVGLSSGMEVTAAVDSAIFSCTQCGWWCEIDEESSEDFGLDEWTCLQCCEGGL